MNPNDYNLQQLKSGALTTDHVTALVESFQEQHGLAVDGKCGPLTRALLEQRRRVAPAYGIRFWPLLALADGRQPVITSGFHTRNPSRPTHNGVDLFYRYEDSDPAVPAGNGGAVIKNGERRWWIPPGTMAVAADDGVVATTGRLRTGLRCWVDHGNGLRTGYFHLLTLEVRQGQRVEAGQPLGEVGHNPSVDDPAHLHFEVSPVGVYRPMDPETLLEVAEVMPAG